MKFDISVEVNNKKEVYLNLSTVQNSFVFDFKRLVMEKNQVENLNQYIKRYNGRTLKVGEEIGFKLMSDKGVSVFVRFVYHCDFENNKQLKLYVENECIKCALNVEREKMLEFAHSLSKVSKLFEKKKIFGLNNMQLKMIFF